MPPALTPSAIAAAKPGDILRDPVVPGLHLRVTAQRKSFYLYFRTKSGDERRPKLGDHNVLTLAQARQVAKDMLLQVANGRDPMSERHARQDAPTVAVLAERYWERHASKQKASRDVRRHLDRYILPLLGTKRAADIVYTDAERLHAHVAAGAPIQANRVMATFSKMLSLAERWQCGR
jgi:hypothetical protein